MKRLSTQFETIAQKLYDIRDASPAYDIKTWQELNAIAIRLSKLAGRQRKKETGIPIRAIEPPDVK